MWGSGGKRILNALVNLKAGQNGPKYAFSAIPRGSEFRVSFGNGNFNFLDPILAILGLIW